MVAFYVYRCKVTQSHRDKSFRNINKIKKTSEENKQKYGLIKTALIFTMAAYQDPVKKEKTKKYASSKPMFQTVHSHIYPNFKDYFPNLNETSQCIL